MPALKSRGLIAVTKVRAGQKGYEVFCLTEAGRVLLASKARRRRREADEEEDSEQRYWVGLADARQLRHDHHVFEAVMQDTEEIRNQGGRIRTVRLETELRGILAAAGESVRPTEGAHGADRARREAAERIGLRVVAQGVPLPDALVEIEDADGHRSVRAIEVVTGAYTKAQVREKQNAGFRLFRLFGVTGSKREHRRYGIPDTEGLYPLSWGRSR